jgi:hypothetical protein
LVIKNIFSFLLEGGVRMEQAVKELEIACPACGTTKSLRIPLKVFSQKKYGFVKIQVPQGAVCEDRFMILADPSKLQKEEEIKDEQQNGPSLISFIREFGFNCVAGLIHASLFGYSSFIISKINDTINVDPLNNTIDELIPEKYRNSHALEKIEYDPDIYPNPGFYYALIADQQKFDFLINPHKHVIQDPFETDIKYEQVILRNALKEKEEIGIQFKIIADSVLRFIRDVEFAISILNDSNKISEKDLMKVMNDRLTLSSINKTRMKYIKEFINRRVSPILASKIK